MIGFTLGIKVMIVMESKFEAQAFFIFYTMQNKLKSKLLAVSFLNIGRNQIQNS